MNDVAAPSANHKRPIAEQREEAQGVVSAQTCLCGRLVRLCAFTSLMWQKRRSEDPQLAEMKTLVVGVGG